MIRLLTGFLLLGAVQPLRGQDRHEFTEIHMGVAVRVVLHAPDTATARHAARAAYDRIARLEDIFSDYRAGSELRRLEARTGEPIPVSTDLARVLQVALQVAEATNGAFDPTAAPLVGLWRETRRTGVLPGRSALDSARALVGWRHLHFDSVRSTIEIDHPGIRLDLGGIAKGYIVGQALSVLRSLGTPAALIEAGGDIVLGDPPPGRAGWDVVITGRPAEPRTRLAVATSGSSEQSVTIAGIRFGHIVDPRTGLGVTTQFQATVLGPDPALADALATALVILGPDAQGWLLAGFPGYRATVIVPDQLEVTAPMPPPQFLSHRWGPGRPDPQQGVRR